MNYGNGSSKNLRKIVTSKDYTLLKDAQKNGQVVLFETVEPNPDFYTTSTLFRNYETGDYKWAEGRISIVQYNGLQHLSEEEYEEILTAKTYAREISLSRAWSAYVLPVDVKVGERLFVEDLIQDVSMGGFWGTEIMATNGEAVWDGEKLVFDESLWEDHGLIG